MEQICLRKNEGLHSGLKYTAGPTTVLAREMNVASTTEMIPMLNLKPCRCESQTLGA